MTTVMEPRLLTAEDYLRLSDNGVPTELVRGRTVEMKRSYTSHGYFCMHVGVVLWQFVEPRGLGRIVSNDAGVVVERNPDTVRGPDVAYYSYQRVPHGPLLAGYWPASPELVFEIRSPDDRWKDLLQKVAEYLNADVLTVLIEDPESRKIHLFSPDRECVILHEDNLLTIPEVLPGFEVPVRQLFE